MFRSLGGLALFTDYDCNSCRCIMVVSLSPLANCTLCHHVTHSSTTYNVMYIYDARIRIHFIYGCSVLLITD